MDLVLRVNYVRDFDGSGEKILYVLESLPNGTLPAAVDVSTHWWSVVASVDALRQAVQCLVDGVVLGRPAGQRPVDAPAAELARDILPQGGFRALLPPDGNLVLDVDERLAFIPWEAFDEGDFLQCEADATHVQDAIDAPGVDTFHCSRCGSPMRTVHAKLAVKRTVSHVVRPCVPREPREGGPFLAILDPCGDLCARENDPTGACKADTEALLGLLGEHFETLVLRDGAVTSQDVLRHIARDDLAGIYYLGHSQSHASEGGASLTLADGPLFARQIRRVQPTAPLIVLNTGCAECMVDRQTGGRIRESVARAFARGLAKTVVAQL